MPSCQREKLCKIKKYKKSTQTEEDKSSKMTENNQIKTFQNNLINPEIKSKIERKENLEEIPTINKLGLSKERRKEVLEILKSDTTEEIIKIETEMKNLKIYHDIILENYLSLKNYRDYKKEKLIGLYQEIGSDIDSEEIEKQKGILRDNSNN